MYYPYIFNQYVIQRYRGLEAIRHMPSSRWKELMHKSDIFFSKHNNIKIVKKQLSTSIKQINRIMQNEDIEYTNS